MAPYPDDLARSRRCVETAETPADLRREGLDRDLVFVERVGMLDPPPTAAAIGRQFGLDPGLHGRSLATVRARELDAQVMDRVVWNRAVFGRVSPRHKLLLVEALQRRRWVVAMTGDGVNETPALEKSETSPQSSSPSRSIRSSTPAS